MSDGKRDQIFTCGSYLCDIQGQISNEYGESSFFFLRLLGFHFVVLVKLVRRDSQSSRVNKASNSIFQLVLISNSAVVIKLKNRLRI